MSRTRALQSTVTLWLAALVLIGGPAVADASGWYVEGKLGQSSLDDRFGSRFPKVFDDEADTRSVEVGYAFNEYIGVQAGYHDLGTFQGLGAPCPESAEGCIAVASPEDLILCAEPGPCVLALFPIEADVHGMSLAAVPSWPFTERFSVFGKIGVLDWQSDLSSSTPLAGRGTFESFRNTDLLTGIGLRYRFGKSVGAVAEVQQLDLDLGSATLGVSWKF